MITENSPLRESMRYSKDDPRGWELFKIPGHQIAFRVESLSLSVGCHVVRRIFVDWVEIGCIYLYADEAEIAAVGRRDSKWMWKMQTKIDGVMRDQHLIDSKDVPRWDNLFETQTKIAIEKLEELFGL